MSNTDCRENDSLTKFEVQFWGVRNEIATPGENNLRYGGNTACVEMRVGAHYLIFDGGTGIRQLGNRLLGQMPVEAFLFFTHCHWDRIQGFPFFVPAFIPGNCFHIYGGVTATGSSFQEHLKGQMMGPNFPVPIEVMQSELKFHNLTTDEIAHVEDIIVEANFLNDIHHSLGYRITYQGQSVVYATETEYKSDSAKKQLLEFIKEADLLILDTPHRLSSVSSQESSPSITPWLNCVEMAKTTRVKQVIVSLHAPDHDDNFLDQMQSEVQSIFPNVLFAQEGMIISVSP